MNHQIFLKKIKDTNNLQLKYSLKTREEFIKKNLEILKYIPAEDFDLLMSNCLHNDLDFVKELIFQIIKK